MARLGARHLDETIDIFGINVRGAKLVEEGARIRAYEVSLSNPRLGVYLIDTPEARCLAAFPHIVGRSFSYLNLLSARRSLRAILDLADIRQFKDNTFVLQILRAGPGYRLHEALSGHLGRLGEIYVRPVYTGPSFRDHLTQRRIKITYRDYSALEGHTDVAVVVQDTVATGRTLKTSLKDLFNHLTDLRIELLMVYGFISDRGLEVIREMVEGHKISRVQVFPLVDVAALASNNYDMVLYGPDERYFSTHGEHRLLGATVGYETLVDCIEHYVPGLDQPGDWSSRQAILYNGLAYEEGNMRGHLESSRNSILRLVEISSGEPWFREWHLRIAERHLRAIGAVLGKL